MSKTKKAARERELQLAQERFLLEKIQILEKKKKLKEGLPHLYKFPFYKWSQEFFESRDRLCLLTAANQIGKAECMKTLISTPGGWKKLGDLVVGDWVFALDGTATRVVDIPFEGMRQSYRVTFTDGASVECSSEHLWVAKSSRERFRKVYKNNTPGYERTNKSYDEWNIFTTQEIIEKGGYSPQSKSNYTRFSIPIAGAVKYPPQKLPVDPYLLGLFLGNGSFGSRKPTFTTADLEVRDFCNPWIEKWIEVPSPNLACWSGRAKDPLGERVGFDQTIRANSKFIPELYLRGSINQRKALLAGLMDTDGTCTQKGIASYCTVSKKLSDDLSELVCSLGGRTKIKQQQKTYTYKGQKKKGQVSYDIRIWLSFNPFRLKRKADRFVSSEDIRYRNERVIESIRPLGKKKMRCITVAHSSGTFLCTKNYIVTHNSTTQIKKIIHWATETSLWPELWNSKPNQFHYYYPTKELATVEFDTKWLQLLPNYEFKNDPKYGWKEKRNLGHIHSIQFHSGVTVYFKTYAQSEMSLQAATVYYIALDEEVPISLWDELIFRVAATNGYISMVFTATLGQDFWRQVMEPDLANQEKELLPQARKWQISAYDCLEYVDGSPTPWSVPQIKEIEAKCKNEDEILKRVYGKFVGKDDHERIYHAFKIEKHLEEPGPLPEGWVIYMGVDYGSGGARGHPSAIVSLAVAPDFKKAKVYQCWRGDGIETTAGDLVDQVFHMKKGLPVVAIYYDYACADFFSISTRLGLPVNPADKGVEKGVGTVNTLFRNGMLTIVNATDGQKLATELVRLRERTNKTQRIDHLCDAMRYSIAKVPWDWSGKNGDGLEAKPVLSWDEQNKKDRKNAVLREEAPEDSLDQEFKELHDLLYN